MNEVTKYNNDMNTVTFRRFNSTELDLLMVICSKMRDKKIDSVIFTFDDLKALCDYKSTDTKDFIKTLDNTYNKLIQTNIRIGNDVEWTRFVLFTEYTINTSKKTVEIAVNKRFQYVLNELTSNFTRFELKEFIDLRSSYSKECYRHLKQFRKTGRWIVQIDEFRRLLDIPDSYRMCNINKRVIEPIQNELQFLFGNLKITKIKKKGRGRGGQIDKLEFTFEPEKNPKVEKENSQDKKQIFKKTFFHNYRQNSYSEEELIAITGLDKNRKK